MNTKKNIVIFIDWFWPGYLAGGPVQSIVSLVNQLGNDFNFKIITTNYDLNSQKSYAGIQANTWITSPLGCEVYYADPSTLSYKAVKEIMSGISFDKAYINSFFSKFFSIIPLQILKSNYPDSPVILAPRGMLGEGALNIKKYKKKAFIVYSKISGLHRNIIWHATSLQEENEIIKIFHPQTQIIRISNLPKHLEANTKKQKNKAELKLCFISRISEKKNLYFALLILKEIKNIKIRYNIYGPLEDVLYWDKCQTLIKELPQNIEVNYKGSISPEEIANVYAEEQLLFLPTLNENFGHSIVESLLCGCPVIISDQTPWNDLEEHGAGYAISLSDKTAFITAIEKCAALNQEEFSAMSFRAINYISKKIDLEVITNQYKKLFNDRTKN